MSQDPLFSDDAASVLMPCEVLPQSTLSDAQDIEGFPLGEWSRIRQMSCAPEYCAFPSPFIADMVESAGNPAVEDSYRVPPYAADVSEGKNDPYYATFNYHTKVPPVAIARYIAHYTEPNDVVLDCFCGSGMTGLAAKLLGNWPSSYPNPEGILGARRAVVSDLSPVATYLAHAFSRSVDGRRLQREADQIASELEAELGHLYRVDGRGGRFDYMVWSDVLECQECGSRHTFWEAAIDASSLEQHDMLGCPSCFAQTSTRNMVRATVSFEDPVLGEVITMAAEKPVRLFLKSDGGKIEVAPTEDDEALLEEARLSITEWVPLAELPRGQNTDQPRSSHGITHVHQFYNWRALRVLAWLNDRVDRSPDDLAPLLRVIVFSMHARASRRNRNIPKYGHRHVGVLSGTLYIPSIREELNLIETFRRRAKKAAQSIGSRHLPGEIRISTQSATDLSNVPADSIDYCFIDPPFGGNINYSELNFLWEAWLGVYTNVENEAIVNAVQAKGFFEYQSLMERSFAEIHRVLKPGRWMTVEFHNSSNAIWAAIQEALASSGFVIADVRTLDKKKGTIKQLSTSNAAKHDLVVSAYKPRGVDDRAPEVQASQASVWGFVAEHLAYVSVWDGIDGGVDVVRERTKYMLFDRMIAHFVGRGRPVPISTSEFYAGLVQRYPERDGMYFLPEQVAEYDKHRAKVDSVQQLSLMVTDELSAIQWVRQQLADKPQPFSELQPTFMREAQQSWAKHEEQVELKELLEENFLIYDGAAPVPSQIKSYLSTNWREYRNLEADDPSLQAKAMNRWYVPDPGKSADLEKLRERQLLKEFEHYRSSTARKIKVFRTEAVRAGFKRAYDERDWETIVAVAGRLPESVVQEDEKLLMYYDVARMRVG